MKLAPLVRRKLRAAFKRTPVYKLAAKFADWVHPPNASGNNSSVR